MIPPEAIERATAEVNAELELQADYYPANLPNDHIARLTGWHSSIYGSQKLVVPGAVRDFNELSPLEQHLETNRCHAEALLVHERLGQIIFNAREREELVQRAIGLLPVSETLRFAELHTCPALRPRRIGDSARSLAEAAEAITAGLGAATALAYVQLVVAGLRARAEFDNYGRKLDTFFDRVTAAPSVIQALDQLAAAGHRAGFETRFRLLVAVRDSLWRLKPGRLSPEGSLLPKVLDAMLGPRPSAGNSIGLGLLDAYIISRLGYEVRFLLAAEQLLLEVIIENRSIYWETARPEPLSFVPVATITRLEPQGLLSLTISCLAANCYARGLWDKAIEHYRRALELYPDAAATHASIGACYLRKGWPQDAVKSLEVALRIAPENHEALQTLGGAYCLLHQWPRAIDAYKRALRVRPDSAEVHYNLALAFRNAGESAQAEAALAAALELKPNYIEARLALGNLHFETGRFDEAIREYREAAHIEPNNASIYYNLGRAYYEKHQLDNAIHAYEKCIAINPKHAAAWHNLGIAYRDRGQKDKAIAALEKAVTINPNLLR